MSQGPVCKQIYDVCGRDVDCVHARMQKVQRQLAEREAELADSRAEVQRLQKELQDEMQG